MAKRKTLPDVAEGAFSSRGESARSREPKPTMREKSGGESTRQRVAADIAGEVLESARNAVYWTPGLSLRELIEEGVRIAVAELEERRGQPFPERPERELRRGRKGW